MKLKLFFFIFFINLLGYSQLPNDCANYIIICGNSEVALDIESGPGTTQEVNSCESQEHNSVWFKLNIETSGNLAFTLTPESTNINEDYDFFIYGPNRPCSNLGETIRCSTTSPSAAGSTSNLTGMNSTETDESEGPGSDGNNFVQWLPVNAGESYFLVIDRASGSSSFSLDWTSSTNTFNEAPTGDDFEVNLCPNSLGEAHYNLRENESNLINGQDVTVTYYNTISDAQIKTDSIIDPENYTLSSDKTVYVRLENNITECFSIFEILMEIGFEINTPNTLFECTDGLTNTATFNFEEQGELLIGNNENTIISYYISENHAITTFSPIGNIHTNTTTPQEIWYRLDNTDNGCNYIGSFFVEIIPFFDLPEPNFTNDEEVVYCKDSYPETIDLTITLENNDINNYSFLWSTGETTASISIKKNENYSILITNSVGCELIKTFHVVNSKVFSLEEPNFKNQFVYYCTNTFPEYIYLETGIVQNDISDYTFLWSTTATTEVIGINAKGNYIVAAINEDGCFLEKTITVLPSSIPLIGQVLVTDTTEPNKVSLIIQTFGDGDYIYAIDIDELDIDDNSKFRSDNYFDGISYGEHIITVKDINGCGFSQKKLFLLKYQKFFTPNNDGINDTWNIDNNNSVNNAYNITSKIYIYDRFEKEIAVIDANENGWDGKFNGELLPEADYWFQVRMIDFNGKYIIKKGHFSLVK